MRRIGERILNAKAPTAIVLSCRSYYDGATARDRRSLSRKLRHVDLRDAASAYIETRDLQLPGNNRLRPTPSVARPPHLRSDVVFVARIVVGSVTQSSALLALLDEPIWFCLKAQPKREHLAAIALRRQFGIECFSPRLRFRKMTNRGPVWFVEAMFPGYLFAKFVYSKQHRAVEAS